MHIKELSTEILLTRGGGYARRIGAVAMLEIGRIPVDCEPTADRNAGPDFKGIPWSIFENLTLVEQDQLKEFIKARKLRNVHDGINAAISLMIEDPGALESLDDAMVGQLEMLQSIVKKALRKAALARKTAPTAVVPAGATESLSASV